MMASVLALADRLAAALWVGPSLRATTRFVSAQPHDDELDRFVVRPPLPSARFKPARFTRFSDEALDVRWASTRDDAAARIFFHAEPARTAVILVHGYLGGSYLLEERIWAARELYHRGFDVALMTLPLHGVRAMSHSRFPSADTGATIEAAHQAIYDLRGLLQLLRARGATAVGAMGMSLGGYLVALLATLEPQLAFAVPIVPLSDLGDFARGRVPNPSPALTQALRVTSPLVRPPVISRDRVLVVGAAADRIAPLSHAMALAAHFNARLEILPGGHFLQLGRARALDWIDRFIDQPDKGDRLANRHSPHAR